MIFISKINYDKRKKNEKMREIFSWQKYDANENKYNSRKKNKKQKKNIFLVNLTLKYRVLSCAKLLSQQNKAI